MTDMPPYLAVKDEENSDGQSDSENSSDVDDWDLPLSFDKPRHTEPIKGAERVEHSWRVKEKYKTHCVALVLCLNVGVDPPDIVKTQPCARLECWIDPNSLSPSKALESIGHALQLQYERWQPRARYKQSLDPTSDEVKKLCCSLRRNAKDERVLFHYNGHGVPKPTVQGEIWVFNRAYTQYIPLSMYDLQTWMGAPSLYVYDCSNAGVIVDNFKQFADQHEREYEAALSSKGSGEGPLPAAVSYKNCIQLGACAAGQSLPMNPELPADLFTACLTTPVKMAMKWFVLRARTHARSAPHDLIDLIDKIPGQVTDRRTMLGELNWIFTAITDTIAWSSLPSELFQQLFRADLLTASLCRNFLLADRIMRSYNCTPVSLPALPSLARHPLWAAWEHTLDLALAQLPRLLDPRPPDYTHSPFFRDQLTAFQVWLDLGRERDLGLDASLPRLVGSRNGKARRILMTSGSGARSPPAQLPMVLQVLLSTLHRVRALRLLCRFLALGAWAARAVLHVGIFPYMLKLLQASAHDLKASMVYIWAKIIALDPSCQVDLVNAKGHKYFLSVLQDSTVDSEHRTLAAYVLAGIVDNYPVGQEAALQGSMISICLEQLGDRCAALRLWACIGLGRLWRGYDAARWAGVRDLAHEKLYPLLQDPTPEVRAACAFALGTFVTPGAGGQRTEHGSALEHQVGVHLAARAHADASALVRQEILAALQWLVLAAEHHFIAVCLQERGRRSDRESRRARAERAAEVDRGVEALVLGARPSHSLPRVPAPAQPIALPSIGFGSVYMKLWNTLCAMAREPHPQISQMATDIVNYIANQVDSVGREVEVPVRSSGTSSLPPSPNTRPSPLLHAHDHIRTLPHPGSRRARTGLPHTISEDSVANRDRDRERTSDRDTPRDRDAPRDPTRDLTRDTTRDPTRDLTRDPTRDTPRDAPRDRERTSERDTPRERDRDSTSSNTSQTAKKPIVRSQFVEWAAAQFSQPEGGGSARDAESRPHHERVWRYARNRSLRQEARGLRTARVKGLETQAFHSRCPLPPAQVLFHPYDQHAAVASKDNFGIWDWGTGAKLCVGSWRKSWGRISALAYLNAHDRALLAVASHSGNLAIYRPGGSIAEPQLVAAWRALLVRPAPDYRPPPAQPLISLAQLVSEQFTSGEERAQAGRARLADTDLGVGVGSGAIKLGAAGAGGAGAAAGAGAAGGAGGAGAGGWGAGAGAGGWGARPPGTLLRWCARRRSLALAGPAPLLRLWDAHTELLHADIDTKCEASVTSLWRGSDGGGSGGWTCVCGFGDGSVRAWDERAPAAPAYSLHHHAAPVLCAAARRDRHKLLTACTEGMVRIYDARKLSLPAAELRAPAPLAAVDVHPRADLMACGSVNQCISVYDLAGARLNTIKFHEGFMGARIGPVSCLAFHPLRVALGVGSMDSSVCVYVSEARR